MRRHVHPRFTSSVSSKTLGPAVLWLTLLVACSPPPAPYAEERRRMVVDQIESRGLANPRILTALREVPRHLFVPASVRARAYEDRPLPIGYGQTISQPYIVALMTELARPEPGDRALEVGTGSGYQAAILARLVREVHSIEIIEPLGREAGRRLGELGFSNVFVRVGDGYGGWPEAAPFDIILVTAAPEQVPPPLIAQLKPGGRMVIPVGAISDVQRLQLIQKDLEGRIESRTVLPVRFVPLTRSR